MSIEHYKRKILELLSNDDNKHGLPTYELQQVVDDNEEIEPPYLDVPVCINKVECKEATFGAFSANITKAICELSNERKIHFRIPAKISQTELRILFHTGRWGKKTALFLDNWVWCSDPKKIKSWNNKGKMPLVVSFAQIGTDPTPKNMDTSFWFETYVDEAGDIVYKHIWYT